MKIFCYAKCPLDGRGRRRGERTTLNGDKYMHARVSLKKRPSGNKKRMYVRTCERASVLGPTKFVSTLDE